MLGQHPSRVMHSALTQQNSLACAYMGCDLCHLAPRQGNPACSSLPPVTSFGRCVSFFTAAKAAPTTGMN